MVNLADIPDGTWVRGRPIRYNEENSEIDVLDYKSMGIGPVVEGPLAKFPSILGHTSCYVGQVAVEEESIEVIERI